MFLKQHFSHLLISFFSLCLIGFLWYLPVDKYASDMVDSSLKEAVVVFGIAKGLNALISVAQGTQASMIPGFIFSIGEVLDPVNDLIEQFSWVMLASITSLGLQKIIANIVVGKLFFIILTVSIAIFNIWLFIRFNNDAKPRKLFFKWVTVLIFLRISMPLMAIANLYIYENYVKQDFNIESSQQSIANSSTQINQLMDKTQEKSMWDSWSEKFRVDYYQQKFTQYEMIAEKASTDILNLIVAFVFKAMLFPLIFLFFLYKLLKNLFSPEA